MKNTIMAVIIFLLLLTACDNAVNDNADNPDPNSTDGSMCTVSYSAEGPDVSRFLGRQWAKEGTDFVWIFKNDGTVSVIHCCGDLEDNQFGYLLRGNVLITYGAEEGLAEIEATNFIMADNDVSFTRDNGTKFIRGEADTGSSPASPVVLSNELLGTWQGDDGTKYAFSSDTGLKINSRQYGYFALYNELLTLGPLVDGETADLRYYTFNRKGDKLYLRRSDGQKYTLSRSE